MCLKLPRNLLKTISRTLQLNFTSSPIFTKRSNKQVTTKMVVALKLTWS